MEKPLRIKFYSIYDMSVSEFLREIEAFFKHWEENIQAPDLVRVLELYNVKKYIDAKLRLKDWSEDQFSEYQKRCSQIPQIIGTYFGRISDADLREQFSVVDWGYVDDFWQLICDYKVYQRFTPDVLKHLMEARSNSIWHILEHKELVTSFGQVLAEELSHHPNTAEELLSNYLAADRSNGRIYLPDEFTQTMKDQVLSDYIDSDYANLNFLELLSHAQSTKEFPLSDKLKLKAQRRKEVLKEKLFDQPGFSYGAEVTFKSIPDGSVEEGYRKEDHVYTYTYSQEWVKENQDYPTLLNNFIYLFEFVDDCFRCSFVSLKSELGTLEKHLGVKGRKDYLIGIRFDVKRVRTLLQMYAYCEILQKQDIQLETVIQWFFETYLKDEFHAEGFVYKPPSDGTTYIEKCKLLASAIDGILKQYRLYCEEGQIDRELLELSSGHVVFSDLPSRVKKKYVYADSQELRQEMALLFSDQSIMHYTEKTKSKYQTLPQMLIAEKMKREDFAVYQQGNLDWLLERGTLILDEENVLRINTLRAILMKELFTNEVMCPQYYDKVLQNQVEEFVKAGDMRYESTLFSKPEQDYLNYILNKSEFSNGLDLRNKYIHDTCPLDEKIQRQDYMELMKIMVLIVIKVNEEFCLLMPATENTENVSERKEPHEKG